MQPCPNCGVPLPNNASFCTRCGFALSAAHMQARQKMSKPEHPDARENKAIKGTQAFSAPPNTPQPGEIQNSEVQMTPIPPSSQNIPPPVPTNKSEAKALLPVPTVGNTPRPVETPPIEEQKTREVSAMEKTPPAKAENIEAQRTLLLPPPSRKSLSVQKTTIEAQKTRSVPTVGQLSSPTGAATIEAQKTREVPSVGKMPPSAPRKPLTEEKTLSFVEAQMTMPVAAVQTPARNSQPAVHPRSNDVFVTPRRAPQAGPTQRNMTQAPPRAIPSGAPAPAPMRKPRGLAWRILSPIFTRALDPEPEHPVKPPINPLGWLPVMALTSALGLFTVATAYNAARDNNPEAELYFWLGLALIFLPAVVRLILPQVSRFERVGLICTVAICLYLTKVTLSPLHFNGYDEFLHWRTVNDIMSTGQLFTANSMLPVSPFYPGLEIVTSALSNLSGLSTFQSGLIVVGIAHLLMILSLFLLCEQLTGSARLASIATVVYMTNSHSLFFDSQYAYESLALPLATFVLFAMTRYEMVRNSRRWIMLAAWLVLTAMILTHHATNFIFEGLFLLWATIYLFLRPLPLRKSIVIFTVIVGLVLTVVTVLLIGNTVITYFTSFFSDIGSEVTQALAGSSGTNGARPLFSTAGTPTPLWERLLSLGSVGLITLSIPFFLLCFWRRYRRNTLVWVFAIIVIFYPVLQVLRLTSSGAELSDRLSAFIYLAISFLAAVAIVQFWPVRLLNWKQPVVLSAVILMLFMGGLILGEGIPPSFMPGPYEVSADGRSIDPEGIQAALWAATYLGPNNRMYTDRVNQLLMSVYGNQHIVTLSGDGVDLSDMFFEQTADNYVTQLLQEGKVHYLAVDMRLASGPPQDGYYFEQGEQTPAPSNQCETQSDVLLSSCLTKFDNAPQIDRVFDSGNIAIYDTGGLINAPQTP